jgi:hypothetical protein
LRAIALSRYEKFYSLAHEAIRTFSVMPVKTGIQYLLKFLHSGSRRPGL